MLIFSKPKTAKVRDMQRSPAVSLALDSADGGQDIVLADGRAKLITAAGEHPHFLAGQFRLARGGEQVPDRIFNTPAAAGPRKSLLSIRPFAPSNNFTPALTSAFTRVEDDLVFAGTQGGLRACRPTYL